MDYLSNTRGKFEEGIEEGKLKRVRERCIGNLRDFPWGFKKNCCGSVHFDANPNQLKNSGTLLQTILYACYALLVGQTLVGPISYMLHTVAGKKLNFFVFLVT
jgi:hypothetical protein